MVVSLLVLLNLVFMYAGLFNLVMLSQLDLQRLCLQNLVFTHYLTIILSLGIITLLFQTCTSYTEFGLACFSLESLFFFCSVNVCIQLGIA